MTINRRNFFKKAGTFSYLLGMMTIGISTESCLKNNDTYAVNASKCDGCAKCVSICGVKAISISNDKATISESKCVGCGHCARVCPQGAISQS